MFTILFVTPENIIYEGEAKSIIAPGIDGYFEILAHHAPLLAGLQPGKATLTLPDGHKRIYAVGSGFLEMEKNKVSLLADSAELAANIDLARANAALKRATKLLHAEDPNTDIPRAKDALKRAETRIKVATEEKKRH